MQSGALILFFFSLISKEDLIALLRLTSYFLYPKELLYKLSSYSLHSNAPAPPHYQTFTTKQTRQFSHQAMQNIALNFIHWKHPMPLPPPSSNLQLHFFPS